MSKKQIKLMIRECLSASETWGLGCGGVSVMKVDGRIRLSAKAAEKLAS